MNRPSERVVVEDDILWTVRDLHELSAIRISNRLLVPTSKTNTDSIKIIYPNQATSILTYILRSVFFATIHSLVLYAKILFHGLY